MNHFMLRQMMFVCTMMLILAMFIMHSLTMHSQPFSGGHWLWIALVQLGVLFYLGFKASKIATMGVIITTPKKEDA